MNIYEKPRPGINVVPERIEYDIIHQLSLKHNWSHGKIVKRLIEFVTENEVLWHEFLQTKFNVIYEGSNKKLLILKEIDELLERDRNTLSNHYKKEIA